MTNDLQASKNHIKQQATNKNDGNQSIKVDTLTAELNIVKKALEEQQMMVKELQDELKDKTRLLDKKDLQIESLKHTISKLSSFF
jgi:chromosome segregation ATPase